MNMSIDVCLSLPAECCSVMQTEIRLPKDHCRRVVPGEHNGCVPVA